MGLLKKLTRPNLEYIFREENEINDFDWKTSKYNVRLIERR